MDYIKHTNVGLAAIIRSVLSDAAENGFNPDENYFVITFDPTAGCTLPEWMFERFGKTMTIVIQYWFEDLIINDSNFHVTLNFGDVKETLCIPFSAITDFADPAGQFGIKLTPMVEFQDPDIGAEFRPGDEQPAPTFGEAVAPKTVPAKPNASNVVNLFEKSDN